MLGRTLGSYRISRRIAQGGMGVVYEANHVENGRRAAVKVLLHELTSSPDAANRFFNEARAVSMVSHPGLVTIYDHGKSPDGEAYIVMEFIEGESLRERLEKQYLGGSALDLVRQMAAALQTTHKARIIHRDLKPENIMLVPDAQGGGDHAKILDFGIAKLLPDGSPNEDKRSVKTRTGTLIGTPTYMSPEQCRASEPIDEKTDVYSLGVIFYELLYGEPPFTSESAGELFALQMFAAAPDLRMRMPEAEPKLAALVHRLLDKKPAERPSITELLSELQALPANGLQNGPVNARPSRKKSGTGTSAAGALQKQLTDKITGSMGRGEQVAAKAASRRKMTTLGVAAGLALLIVLALLFSSRRSDVKRVQVPAATLPADLGAASSASAAKQSAAEAPASSEKPVSAPLPIPQMGKKPHKSRADKKGGQGSKNGKVDLDLWN